MLFSIIIPGFNCSETIYNAISSIVDQNYLDLEIIYCDDCSEDDSVNVVKRVLRFFKAIRIVGRGICEIRELSWRQVDL